MSRVEADVKILTSASLMLSLQINKLCQHLVCDRDDLGVCLEPTLCGDHLDKFCGNVHVRLLKGVG